MSEEDVIGGTVWGKGGSFELHVMEKGEGILGGADVAESFKERVEQGEVKRGFGGGKKGVEGSLCIRYVRRFEDSRKNGFGI